MKSMVRATGSRVIAREHAAGSARSRFSKPEAGYWVAQCEVAPISVVPVGDLLARHVAAGIELRIVQNLWPLADAIVSSGLEFSIIRMVNAQPRLTPAGSLGRS